MYSVKDGPVAMDVDQSQDSYDPDQPLDLSLSSHKSKDHQQESLDELKVEDSPGKRSRCSSPNSSNFQLKVPSIEGKFPR